MLHDQCIRELARFFRREGLNLRTWITATIVVCLVMIYGTLAHAEVKYWDGTGVPNPVPSNFGGINEIEPAVNVQAPQCKRGVPECHFQFSGNTPACENPNWTFWFDGQRAIPSGMRAGPYSQVVCDQINKSQGHCIWITSETIWKVIQIAKYQAPSANHEIFCVVPEGTTDGYCKWMMAYPNSGNRSLYLNPQY